jgi:hypothetical protein
VASASGSGKLICVVRLPSLRQETGLPDSCRFPAVRRMHKRYPCRYARSCGFPPGANRCCRSPSRANSACVRHTSSIFDLQGADFLLRRAANSKYAEFRNAESLSSDLYAACLEQVVDRRDTTAGCGSVFLWSVNPGQLPAALKHMVFYLRWSTSGLLRVNRKSFLAT